MDEPSEIKKHLHHLEKRVEKIETYLDEEYGYREHEAVSESVFQEHKIEKAERAHAGPSTMEAFAEWLKTDWLMKLGAFLLLLALGWFVTYAFVNNWIGPMGRIALGILAGAAIMVSGHLVIPKRRAPGQVLTVLGGVMILLTIFAARTTYDFFTPASALAMMSVVVVGMAIIAIIHNAKSVAILALLGGAIVPLLVNSPQPNYLVLLSYVFVLNLGTIFVAALKGWREMITLALIITGLYGLAAFPGLETKEGVGVVWVFMALYFGLFFVSNIAAIFRTKMAKSSDLFTTAINGLLLLYWIYEFVPRESASLVLSGIILILIGISYILVQLGGLKEMLYIHAGLAVLFLGTATAFELDGEMLTIAYSIEAFALVVLAMFALKSKKLAHGISIVQAIPVLMAFTSMDGYWHKVPLFNKDFFVLLVVITSLSATTYLLKKYESKEDEMPLVIPQGIVAGLFAIALIWLSTHNIFDSVNIARGTALIIYSIVGVVSLFYGTHLQKKAYRIIGGVLLGGVVLRLLFVEVWSMSLASKIVTFVAIGVLLVSTAFFQKRITNPK